MEKTIGSLEICGVSTSGATEMIQGLLESNGIIVIMISGEGLNDRLQENRGKKPGKSPLAKRHPDRDLPKKGKHVRRHL